MSAARTSMHMQTHDSGCRSSPEAEAREPAGSMPGHTLLLPLLLQAVTSCSDGGEAAHDDVMPCLVGHQLWHGVMQARCDAGMDQIWRNMWLKWRNTTQILEEEKDVWRFRATNRGKKNEETRFPA